MKIQYCSDLHLEFPENEKFLKEKPIKAVGRVLVLAGDIVPFHLLKRYNWFFDHLASEFEQVFWVPGIHEFYHSDINIHSGSTNVKIRDNVSLVNNISLDVLGVQFLFTTLWTKISVGNRFRIQQAMSDFKVIKDGEYPLDVDKYNDLHASALNFLKLELKKTAAKPSVVVTHHVPTFLQYPEKYKNDFLNEAFAVELEAFISSSSISHWIFGHHHENSSDFKIGNTHMHTNQLGYLKYNEGVDFKLNKNFIIN